MMKLYHKFIAIYIILQLSIILVAGAYYQYKIDKHLDLTTEKIDATLKSALNSFKLVMTTINKDLLLYYKIDEKLYIASKTKDPKLAKIRQEVYNDLKSRYELLYADHLKQLHLHFSNGVTFLRMHMPSKYGDNTEEVRPIIKKINSEKKAVEGFEQGRHYHSYRYIYPVFYRNEHIANIEHGIRFNAIKAEMKKFVSADIKIVVKESLVKSIAFPNMLKLYNPCEINPEYVYENTEVQQKIFSELANKIKNDAIIMMSKEKSFSLTVVFEGIDYIVSFVSLKDVTNNHVGYIISVVNDRQISSIKNSVTAYTFLTSLLLIVVLTFSYRKVNFNREISQLNTFYKLTIDALPYSFYVADANTREILLANKKCYVKGKSPEGAKCYEVSHHSEKPCDDTLHPCPLEIVKKTKQPTIVEHIHFNENGDEINVEVHCVPIFDENGNLTKYIEYAADITERKRFEKAIQDSEQKFSAAFNLSPYYMTLSSLDDGRFFDVNNAFCNLVGMQKGEIIGKTLIEVGKWGLFSNSMDDFFNSIKFSGGIKNAELTFINNGGQKFYLLLSAQLLHCLLYTS
ncbi:MAG: PAS domain S-box protein, partial [Thermodesulfovibrionales bacterium]|nr:PAS domain S-box protein [Thermodesulfovibrionales bacterium]